MSRAVRLCNDASVRELPGRLRDQLLGCGTAIGANYRSACRAKSHADYTAKIATVVEEADETVYFRDVLADAGNLARDKVEFHRREAGELLAIFAKSLKTARDREAAMKQSTQSRTYNRGL
jgi:four helix bundle protein